MTENIESPTSDHMDRGLLGIYENITHWDDNQRRDQDWHNMPRTVDQEHDMTGT